MATAVRSTSQPGIQDRAFIGGLALMGFAVVVTLIALVLNSDLTRSFPYLYLLPWLIGLFLVLLTPTAYLFYIGRLTLFDPLVYASWSYFFPAFVVGGIMLTTGWSRPYFLTFIQDAEYNLPYTVVLLTLGFVGLAVGYFSPFGRKAGAALGNILPTKDFDSNVMLWPGLLLLILGTFNTVAALLLGVIGYQRSEVVDAHSGIVFLTTLLWMQGSFVLWYVVFRQGKYDFRSFALVGVLGVVTIGRALFSGNRAGLFQVFLIATLAFLLAGGKMNVRRTTVAAVALTICMVLGMIYGTTFRNVKGSESRVSIDEYTENVFETFEEVGKFDLGRSLEFAFTGIAERLDTLSSVAVVVSTYEQLAPYEESYGLDNNIWKDLSTFFIPRLLWNEKPVASEPRKYSDLYFNYGDNSFAITPIGDLLRNYGPIGVPIGMFFFGIVIRFIYRALIENHKKTIWRCTMYFMLLMAISYESFYGLLIPFLFKVGITAIVGILIVGLMARAMGHRRVADPV